jgi:hypothetical protein
MELAGTAGIAHVRREAARKARAVARFERGGAFWAKGESLWQSDASYFPA